MNEAAYEVHRILRTNTAAEAVDYLATITRGVEEGAHALRAVVGGSYADLIRACDRVAGVDRRCRELAALQRGLAQAATPRANPEKNPAKDDEKDEETEDEKNGRRGRRRGSLAAVVDRLAAQGEAPPRQAAPAAAEEKAPASEKEDGGRGRAEGDGPRTSVAFLASLRAALQDDRAAAADAMLSIKQALAAVDSLVDVDQLARAVFLLRGVRAELLALDAHPEWGVLASMTSFYAKKVLQTMRRRLREDADAAAHLCLKLLQFRIARNEAGLEAFGAAMAAANDDRQPSSDGRKGGEKDDAADAKAVELRAALEELQRHSLRRLTRYHAALRCLHPASSAWRSGDEGLLEGIFDLCGSFASPEAISTPDGVGKEHGSEKSADAFAELRSRLGRVKPSSIITACAEFTAPPEADSFRAGFPHPPTASPPRMRTRGGGSHAHPPGDENEAASERSTLEFLILLVESIVLEGASACVRLSTGGHPAASTDPSSGGAVVFGSAAEGLAAALSLPGFLFRARGVNNSCAGLYLASHAQYLFHVVDRYLAHLASAGLRGGARRVRGGPKRPFEAAIFPPFFSSSSADEGGAFAARSRGGDFVDVAEVAVAGMLREVFAGEGDDDPPHASTFSHPNRGNFSHPTANSGGKGGLYRARDASEMVLQRLSARQEVFGGVGVGGAPPPLGRGGLAERGISAGQTMAEGNGNIGGASARKDVGVSAVGGRWRSLHGWASQEQVQRGTFVRYLLGVISGGEAEAFVFPSQIFADSKGKSFEKDPFGVLRMGEDHGGKGRLRGSTDFWDPIVSSFRRAQEGVLQPFVCAVLNALCRDPLGLVAYHILQYSPEKAKRGGLPVETTEAPVSFFNYGEWERAVRETVREALTRSFHAALDRVTEAQQEWIKSIENTTEHALSDARADSVSFLTPPQRFFPYSSLVLSSVLSPMTTSSSFVQSLLRPGEAVSERSAREPQTSHAASRGHNVVFGAEWLLRRKPSESSPLGRLLLGASLALRGRKGEQGGNPSAKRALIEWHGRNNNSNMNIGAFGQDASLGGGADSLSSRTGLAPQGTRLPLGARWFAVDSIFSPVHFHHGGKIREEGHPDPAHSAEEGTTAAKRVDVSSYCRPYEGMLHVLMRVMAGVMRLIASVEVSSPPHEGKDEVEEVDMAELLGLIFTWMGKTVEGLRGAEAAWSAAVEQEPLPLFVESAEEKCGEGEREAEENSATIIQESSKRARESAYIRHTQRLLKLAEVAEAFLSATELLAISLYQFSDDRRRPPPPSHSEILLENANVEVEDAVIWGFAKNFRSICESIGFLYQRCHYPWHRLLLHEYEAGLQQLYAQDHARFFAIRRVFLRPSETFTDSSPPTSLGLKGIPSALTNSSLPPSRKLTRAQLEMWFQLEHADRWLCMSSCKDDPTTTEGNSNNPVSGDPNNAKSGSLKLSSTMLSPSFTPNSRGDSCCFPYQVTDTLMPLVFALQYLLTLCRSKGALSFSLSSSSSGCGGRVRGMLNFLEHAEAPRADRAAWIDLFRELSTVLDARNTILRQAIVGYLNTTFLVLEGNVIPSLKDTIFEEDKKKAEDVIPVEEKPDVFSGHISDAMLQLYMDLTFLLRVGECRWHEASAHSSRGKPCFISGSDDKKEREDIANVFSQARERVDRILQVSIMEGVVVGKDAARWERLSGAIREASEGFLRRTALSAGLSPSFWASSSASSASLAPIRTPAKGMERFNLLGISSEAFFPASAESNLGGSSTGFSRRFVARPNASAILAKPVSHPLSRTPTSKDPSGKLSDSSGPNSIKPRIGEEREKGEMASPASTLWGSTQRGWSSLWGVQQ